jgi:hypothetical protein
MTSLKGKEALAFHEQLKRIDAIRRDEELKNAKADAMARGKEPFDLQKLETMCDTSQARRVAAPDEERRAAYEYSYYIEHSDVQTLAEFARLITRLVPWS